MNYTTSELAVAPYLAPLSRPMIDFLAQQRSERIPLVTTDLEDQISSIRSAFHETWTSIIERVYALLPQVYTVLLPAIRENRVTSEWFAETMTAFTPNKQVPLTAQALSRWRNKGLLHYDQKDRPNIDNVAALLTLRLLDTQGKKYWHPSKIEDEEALWYCFRQDTPTSPIIPCPARPLPTNIPKNALLYTNYQLARFQPEWLAFGNYGCIRWAGTTIEDGRLLWNLNLDDMRVWEANIDPSNRRILEKANTPLMHHSIATMILLRLATEKFSKQTILLPS